MPGCPTLLSPKKIPKTKRRCPVKEKKILTELLSLKQLCFTHPAEHSTKKRKNGEKNKIKTNGEPARLRSR
jgi:hypothetical protein